MQAYSFVTASRNLPVCAMAIGFLAVRSKTALADLPPDFPTETVSTNSASAVAPGCVFMTNMFAPTGVGYYVMMLNNDGTSFWYKQLANAGFDFKVLPNGYLHYALLRQAASFGGSACVTHEILDEDFNLVEWQLLQVVPVVNSAASFTDTAASTSAARFYRLSAP